MGLREFLPTAARRHDESRSTIYRSDEAEDELAALYAERLRAWPVQYESTYVKTSYGRVHVVVSGPATAPPVLLLHAAAMSAWSWVDNVAILARSLRVYAIDNIGEAGRSVLDDVDHFPDDDRALADHYTEILDRLAVEEAFVVGASNGGFAALCLALHAPTRVKRIALLGPMGITPFSTATAVRMMASQLLPFEAVRKNTVEWALGKDEHVLELCGDWMSWVMRGTVPRLARPREMTRDEKQRIRQPILLVLGKRDALVGNPARARASATFPNVRLAVLDSGHLIAVERAEACNALLVDFLCDDERAANFGSTAG
jgi:pimeloyl-ACP methyl ester carboxylesterase